MKGNLMIQGTMSNVGKSLFTAGLLRVLMQDGFSAAPFKSQNMALNSYITAEGLEMGRAQVMQAEAAGIFPEIAMNPILLKPNSEMGSQVIVNGEVVGNMKAEEYYRKKKEYIPEVLKAYHKLERKYGIIIIEGAGSPAEINLREYDIVNMGLAEMVDAPVLLVGDIDRGGVFAQLYGTVALLEESEKKRVKGFIMNKFRGDRRLLEPGIGMLYDRCRIPVTGVIPYTELDLDDEDSMAERLLSGRRPELIDIVVIRLPHISNFTDFNPLENIENVSLRYVSTLRELGTPDLILLPGTKNTMHDLYWMRENEKKKKIKTLVHKNISLLMGICGGFQMMGRELSDPHCLEWEGRMRGMDLLPLRTVFEEMKVRSRVSGEILPIGSGGNQIYQSLSGSTFSGYEIHMGRTESMEELGRLSSIRHLDDDTRQQDGFVSGSCMGTYVHGIFESGSFCSNLVQLLFDRKGLAWTGRKQIDYLTYKNSQYDLLADIVREHTDLKAIYHMIGMS